MTKRIIKPAAFGDVCRAACTAPARYIYEGWCLFISTMDNSLCLDRAEPATGGESELLLPSDDALDGAFAVIASAKFKEAKQVAAGSSMVNFADVEWDHVVDKADHFEACLGSMHCTAERDVVKGTDLLTIQMDAPSGKMRDFCAAVAKLANEVLR